MNRHQLELELGYCPENPDEFPGEVPEETIVYDIDDENSEVPLK